MMDQVLPFGFLAIIIIFQPELRRALEQIGRGRLFARTMMQEEEERDRLIEAFVKSVSYMAKRRIGALISIEKETGLSEYIETGTGMDSMITSELLINIFIPNTPLHDGAVIVQRNRIAAAGCYLPLSESPFISKELGTRHRAALGISEVTDAVTIIVSEETGAVSLTANGDIDRNLDMEEFEARLRRVWFGLTTEKKEYFDLEVEVEKKWISLWITHGFFALQPYSLQLFFFSPYRRKKKKVVKLLGMRWISFVISPYKSIMTMKTLL